MKENPTQLEIVCRKSGCRAMWTDGTTVLVARGMRFYPADTGLVRTAEGAVLGGPVERTISWFRISRQLFRLGLHHLWPLSDGGYLVVARKRVLRVDIRGVVDVVLRLPRGNKPAHKGVCVTPGGTVFLGEYAVNTERQLPSVLYRSCDNGRTFAAVHEFRPGDVRHIHFVQWDSMGNCLWMGTGDRDEESRIYCSRDNGDTWECVGGGSQLWRAVGLSFRPEAIYWGTDAGSDAGMQSNHVVRLDRVSGRLDKVLEIQGPCHGNATLKDGTLLVSTGVEGGVNEKDHYAHLWASRDGSRWQHLMRFKKDPLPLILQYGVIRFPQGLEHSNRVIFTCLGLLNAGETTCVAVLHDTPDSGVAGKDA